MRVWLTSDGIGLDSADDHVLDLLLGGRRVWSFRPSENAEREKGEWWVAWPRELIKHLDGTADLAVRDASGEILVEAALRFGAGDGDGDGAGDVDAAGDRDRAAVLEDADGHPLAIDYDGRLVRTFESRGADQLVALMDALGVVVGALGRCGVDAFPAYGTLLGAVRQGHVIGHDNDADVGYVSRHTHPADVILESFRLQRDLHHQGLEISRYSGAAFKVSVDTGGGAAVGLDVFAGFFQGGRLILMGEIDTPFERSWVLPLGEVELEDRRFPAPAEPEHLLESMYGPSWRVPDPTFRFRTPESGRRRLDGWFRGTRSYRNLWDRRYSTSAGHGPWNREPHRLARFVHRKEAPGTTIIDVGCGRGQDAVWLANRGHRVVGLDFSPNGFAHLSRRAHAEGWSVDFHAMNLLETRHVLSWGARIALTDSPRAMVARHVLDATTERGRHGLWRLAAMTLAGGGRLYAEFMTTGEPGTPVEYADGLVHDLDPDAVEAGVNAFGGRVVVRRFRDVRGYELPSHPVPGSPPSRVCRMVVEWPA